jgi:hypothetical protein
MSDKMLYRPGKNTPLGLALLTLGLTFILGMSIFFSSELAEFLRQTPEAIAEFNYHAWALVVPIVGFFLVAYGGFLLGRDGGYQRGYADGAWDIGAKHVEIIETLSAEQKKHYELGRKLGHEGDQK